MSWLPYGLLPQVPFPEGDEDTIVEYSEQEDSSLLEMPPDGWSVVYGCIECGCVGVYDASLVQAHHFLVEIEGLCHDYATAYAVEFSCANVHCKAPAKVLVDMTGVEEADIRRLLATGNLVGDLACGHSFVLPNQPDRYKISRVSGRIW
jgi:hypothetical protein